MYFCFINDYIGPAMLSVTLFKALIVVLLITIIISLSSGMFFLVRDQGKTKRLAKSLTVRISLSIALFVLLLIGYFTGIIQPHGLHPVESEGKQISG